MQSDTNQTKTDADKTDAGKTKHTEDRKDITPKETETQGKAYL